MKPEKRTDFEYGDFCVLWETSLYKEVDFDF